MRSINIKFNNVNSDSYKALKDGISVVSFKVNIVDSSLPITVGRIETRLDKASRDTSDFTIINFNDDGTATISYDDNADEEKVRILNKPNSRLFINALTIHNKITAITGFTVSGVNL